MNHVLKGFFLPGLPHPLLAPDKHPNYKKLREGYERVAEEIAELQPDVLLIYSTYWPSVIGHQIQARETIKWTHVDDHFHDLGSIPYEFKMDKQFANTYCDVAENRGLHARTVDYDGFPIDTGSVVALKLVNPSNIPACIVSSNIYADRTETVVLGKSAKEALEKENKKAVVLVISSLSNRLHSLDDMDKEDQISSLKDQEWNLKFLEFLGEGRLEDAAQLSRQFHKEARVPKVSNFKPLWWMSAVMGQTNLYEGEVYEYQSIRGTGNAIVGLTPSEKAAQDLEFDEGDPDYYYGDRNVLGGGMDTDSGSDSVAEAAHD